MMTAEVTMTVTDPIPTRAVDPSPTSAVRSDVGAAPEAPNARLVTEVRTSPPPVEDGPAPVEDGRRSLPTRVVIMGWVMLLMLGVLVIVNLSLIHI